VKKLKAAVAVTVFGVGLFENALATEQAIDKGEPTEQCTEAGIKMKYVIELDKATKSGNTEKILEIMAKIASDPNTRCNPDVK
jgi:hypothetical protein